MTFMIKWMGHAGFLIKTNGRNVYIDPHEGEYAEKADLILITHSHFDHCDTDKISELRKADTTIIAPEDCVSKIRGSVRTLKPGQEMTFNNLKIKAVDAYNVKRFRSPGNPFHPKGSGVGYLVIAAGKTVYHAGDTDFVPEMKQLGHVDVALLPSGSTYTMDNADAAEAALAIKPEVVIPMHRWNTNSEEFKEKVVAGSETKVVLLRPGEEFRVA